MSVTINKAIGALPLVARAGLGMVLRGVASTPEAVEIVAKHMLSDETDGELVWDKAGLPERKLWRARARAALAGLDLVVRKATVGEGR